MAEMETITNTEEIEKLESKMNYDDKREELGGPNVCAYCETDFLETEFEMKEDEAGGVNIVCDIKDCGQLFPNFNEYKIHHRETCPKRPTTRVKKTTKSEVQSSSKTKKSEGSGTRKSLRNRKLRVTPDTEPDEAAIDDSIGKSSKRKPKRVPKKSVVEPDIGLTHSCETCAATFNCRKKLRKHVRLVHELRYVQVCDICGLSCRNKSSLNRHMLTHSTDWKYQCEECGRQFKHKHQLYYHKRRKSGECGAGSLRDGKRSASPNTDIGPTHTCETCAATFNSFQSLKRHILTIHDLAFKETCEICGKGCLDKSSLTSHLVTHTTVRKYKCEECGWQFKREYQLVYHKRKHTNENPYVCDTCGRGFRVNYWLQKHMITHSKDVKKQFPCDFCGKLFASRGYVTSHIWSQHKEKGHKGLETQASQ